MRNYEIVFMIHPDKSSQILNIIGYYKSLIINAGGKIHRLEDWGRKQLSYQINKLHKAHYVLMNIEVSIKIINELEKNFKFNELILRNLIIKVNKVIKEKSPMLKTKHELNKKQNKKIRTK
ncbi:MAG: 30S ribosomal protein S6 [Enterobacterales bacterium]